MNGSSARYCRVINELATVMSALKTALPTFWSWAEHNYHSLDIIEIQLAHGPTGNSETILTICPFAQFFEFAVSPAHFMDFIIALRFCMSLLNITVNYYIVMWQHMRWWEWSILSMRHQNVTVNTNRRVTKGCYLKEARETKSFFLAYWCQENLPLLSG